MFKTEIFFLFLLNLLVLKLFSEKEMLNNIKLVEEKNYRTFADR